MAHPAEFFVKYLLVIGSALSLDDVNLNLEIYGISEISEGDFNRCKSLLSKLPDDFRPWDSRHRTTTSWLRSHKIYSLVFPDKFVEEMHERILKSPPVREKVETLAMSGVPYHEISRQLKGLGIEVSDMAVSEFAHYYWNSTLMGVGGWASYLRKDTTDRTTPLQVGYQLAVRAGPEAAAYRVGVRKELDGKKIMMEVRAELYHTFLETRTLPLSDKKVEMLGNLARGLARIDERVQAGDTALQETLKKFEKFKVLHGAKRVPNLLDLSPTGSVSNRSREEILNSEKK
jgi:hypothetical protein